MLITAWLYARNETAGYEALAARAVPSMPLPAALIQGPVKHRHKCLQRYNSFLNNVHADIVISRKARGWRLMQAGPEWAAQQQWPKQADR